jgi:hypothetical protein
MERKAILGIDVVFSQSNKNELKSGIMLVIILPLDVLSFYQPVEQGVIVTPKKKYLHTLLKFVAIMSLFCGESC